MWLAREQTGYCNDSLKANSPRARFPRPEMQWISSNAKISCQNDFLQRMNMDRLCGWRREALA
jgi:hypothetical protein